MNNGYVYLLLSQRDKRTYVGSTTDICRRLNEHNQEKNRSTKNRVPFVLIYSEEYHSINEARNREKFLKTKKGRNELKRIIESLNI